jgi:double-stranded uracil-DNA glycosylase
MDERSIPRKPTKEELKAAINKTIADVIAMHLRVLFCGINPGLYSGATGHHFARPGNRFWGALHAGEFTPRVIRPWEERELLKYKLGIINFVERTTAVASDLTDEEIVLGGRKLRAKVRRYRPRVLAILGIGAYRIGFGNKSAKFGEQAERIGETRVWVLPNPSGLNAHHTPTSLGKLFAELNEAIG